MAKSNIGHLLIHKDFLPPVIISLLKYMSTHSCDFFHKKLIAIYIFTK